MKKTDTAKNPIFPSGNVATPVTRPLEKKATPVTPPVAPSVEHTKNVTAAAAAAAAVDPIQQQIELIKARTAEAKARTQKRKEQLVQLKSEKRK